MRIIMKRRIFVLFFLMLLMMGSAVYGILLKNEKVFPYRILKSVKNYAMNVKIHWWKVGIYSGPSPIQQSPAKNVNNPVLDASSITDVKASFIADPFLIKGDSLFYLYFEIGKSDSEAASIGYAESKDGFNWNYQHVIISEPFHISFPYVFKSNNDYYLIPESHQDLSVRLYKAVKFPGKWVYVKNLLQGYHYVDPQIVKYQKTWWLFVCTSENDNLNVYYSDSLTGKWKQHPKSPVVKNNKHFARGAGRIILYNGNLYRYAQDDFPSYGLQVFTFKITKLTKTEYKEKLVDKKPIITKVKDGKWNSLGMHTITPVQISKDYWISAVDGF